MDWQPLSREELLDKIAAGLESADDSVRAAWEKIRVDPVKWQCSPWGDLGGGFWVVAETAGSVIWFNDIEDGFNTSRFETRGVIGEYWCNQNDFSEFLLSLPEAQAAETHAASAPAQEVPLALLRPGIIGRRQTTYWELHPAAGPAFRVHFSDKQEHRFVGDAYDAVALMREHPVLTDYSEPWADLFVSRAEHCGTRLIDALRVVVEEASTGWRTLGHYAGGGCRAALSAGSGLLLTAPTPVAEKAQQVVQAHGAAATLIPSRPARPGVHALVLGRSFVLARAFRFESAGA